MDDERVLRYRRLQEAPQHGTGSWFPPENAARDFGVETPWPCLDARSISRRLGQKPNNGVWAAATARAWQATPRPLHARALFAPTPNPPPRPFVALVQVSGLPPHTVCRRHWPNHAERRASVRGGR